jgi:serine protein kinase
MKGEDLLKKFSIADTYKELHWVGTFAEYLDMVREDPQILRTAHQRIYDMIDAKGVEDYERSKSKLHHWKFFDDPDGGGKDAIFGIDKELNKFVKLLRAAAKGLGAQRRILLLHGPVGSSKSTIARLLKKGLEKYTASDAGALYTFEWRDPDNENAWIKSPMNEEPLKIIPRSIREKFVAALFKGKKTKWDITAHRANLDPASRMYFNTILKDCKGDWQKVVNDHVRIRRVLISEEDRTGIGTYQPKDEKSQDATELTGDINYRLIAKYGSDSDPRAFNFDGEYNVANRGLLEFVELLKLDTAFLYDLLGATQEQMIKPRKFAQCPIDELIIGHTNNPEYRKLKNDETMEAFRDRTIKIDIPYCLTLSEEMKIYERDFSDTEKHIAPHTIKVASMWAVLTRLVEPDDASLSILQKLKLYNGKTLPGYTADNVVELQDLGKLSKEGMDGVSPRFIQDKISNSLAEDEYTHVNPFIILNEIEEGLKHHPLLSSPDKVGKFKELLAVVKQEYTDIVKNEVQRAICADEGAIARMCAKYIDNIRAFCQRERIKNKYTGQEEEADEKLMRGIEEKIDIPESRKEDFRREILNYIGALALDGKKFLFNDNERLHKALEKKLFEDQRDTINLRSIVTDVVEIETQKKIDVVKARLIDTYGYNNESADDVLNYVASEFARGDTTDRD